MCVTRTLWTVIYTLYKPEKKTHLGMFVECLIPDKWQPIEGVEIDIYSVLFLS